MENKQYANRDRNNYFFGKLMSVRDFQCEQSYFNAKRRLGNKMLNGAGIVSGLNVILIDNKTISLESGMALDYLGREIVVPESIVRKLNIINGFEDCKDKGIVYLCIRYKEKLDEVTFSVAGAGKSNGVSKEYNRIKEGYELFLTADKPNENRLKLEGLLSNRFEIYNNNGIIINIELNKYVNPQKLLKMTVHFEKKNVEAPTKYSFKIGGEFFKTVEGDKELNIEYNETETSTYKNLTQEYYVYCDAISDAIAQLTIDKKSFSLSVGNDKFNILDDINIPISVKTSSIRDLIIDEYYSKHFDEIISDVNDKNIYLAKFHLITNQLTYFIEDFEKNPFKQYLFSNELMKLLSEIDDSANVSKNLEVKTVTSEESSETNPQVLDLPTPKIDNITTGVERINLGFNPKVGKSYYSYDFVHGLGEGNIAILTAIDNKANVVTNDSELMVFGDKGIFSDKEISISSPNVQIASVVNPKKGTVKLGVKLLEKTTSQTVDIRWWAFKPVDIPEQEEDLIIDENVRVIITPNTTRVKPLEQTRFVAHIEGASSQEVRWAMAENNTGTIDNNGLYTAPSKEGVYEIKAYSVKFEGKSESAYVVVSAD